MAAFVFNYAEERDFRFDDEQLDWSLVKHIRRTVRGLEIADAPAMAWGRAYARAFDVFLQLREAGGGLVSGDLEERSLTFSPANSGQIWKI